LVATNEAPQTVTAKRALRIALTFIFPYQLYLGEYKRIEKFYHETMNSKNMGLAGKRK
jgi:hypothetical protein